MGDIPVGSCLDNKEIKTVPTYHRHSAERLGTRLRVAFTEVGSGCALIGI